MKSNTIVAALAALALAGCGDSPSAAKPTPGTLTATLATPAADDRALMVTVAGPGPITGVEAAGAGYTVFTRAPAGGEVRVAVFGAVAAGPLVKFAVPDTRAAAAYTVTVTEAADAGNAVRSSLAGYAVTVSAR